MPAPRPSGTRPRARRQAERRARRARRAAGLTAIAVVLVVSFFLTAFGSGASRPLQRPLGGPDRLLQASRPLPQVVATAGSLRLQLPVARPTAVGFHTSGDGAVALVPVGRQGNEGGVSHLLHKLFGGGGNGPTWYELGGDQGQPNSAVDIGAAPGTDVYAPVDGTVVGVAPYVLDGKSYGVRIDIQPQTSPSVVVSLMHVHPDPSIAVGTQVVAGVSRLGSVVDVSSVERQALARFTQDAGNNVSLEVRPAATLAQS